MNSEQLLQQANPIMQLVEEQFDSVFSAMPVVGNYRSRVLPRRYIGSRVKLANRCQAIENMGRGMRELLLSATQF